MSIIYIDQVNKNKVIVSRMGVRLFNSTWPGSKLETTRHYWFEFDERRNLVDTDVPEHSDGQEAAAMAVDAESFLFDGETPRWAQD